MVWLRYAENPQRQREKSDVNVSGTRESLALYSDWAYATAVGVPTLALVLLAATFAIGKARTLERSMVPVVVALNSASPGVVTEMPRRSRAERLERAGIAVVFVGAVLLLMCIVLRGWPPRVPPGATRTSSST